MSIELPLSTKTHWVLKSVIDKVMARARHEGGGAVRCLLQ